VFLFAGEQQSKYIVHWFFPNLVGHEDVQREFILYVYLFMTPLWPDCFCFNELVNKN